MNNHISILLLIVCPIMALAQNNDEITASLEELQKDTPVEDFQGEYHVPQYSKLTPIEEVMHKADFCQISKYYMLTPNCATERDEDGVIPVDEVENLKIPLLLNRDIIHYYDLEDEYNTPLKLKRFKDSEDYKYMKDLIEQERESLLSHEYYAIFDVNSPYDIDHKTFTIQLHSSSKDYSLIGENIGIRTNDEHLYWGEFCTPIIDENTAYEIETNNCELIIFVKFTGEADKDDNLAVCKPIKVYIANKKSGKIYLIYQFVEKKEIHTEEQPDAIEKNKVLELVEIQPKFPGGEVALMKFIRDNIRYPKEAADNGIEGRVFVKYIVDKDGSITNPQIVRSVSKELDEEVIRLVKSMPKWKPGYQKGEPVRVTYTLPFTFRLN